jgi:hypothetical protein
LQTGRAEGNQTDRSNDSFHKNINFACSHPQEQCQHQAQTRLSFTRNAHRCQNIFQPILPFAAKVGCSGHWRNPQTLLTPGPAANGTIWISRPYCGATVQNFSQNS